MIIETWVAALFMILIFIIGIVAILGWMISDQRNEDAMKEIKALREENAKLKSKIGLARLYIDLEGKKL